MPIMNSIDEHSDNGDSHRHPDKEDENDDERGLCLQSSNDTASLTLRSSDSNDTVTFEDEEESFAQPSHLRRRPHHSHSSPSSPARGTLALECCDDEDDKKSKYSDRRRTNPLLMIVSLTLMAAFWFLWSPDALDVHTSLRASSWKPPQKGKRHHAHKVVVKIKKRTLWDGITVRIHASRIDLLLQSLDRYSRCKSVKHVQIDWDQPSSIANSLIYHQSGKVVPLGKTNTDAVFLVDETVQLTCEELQRGFHEWKVDPTRLVGFLPLRNGEDGAYSLLSDRAVFAHQLYLDSVTKEPTLNVVNPQCQHLALSAHVAALSLKSPVAITSKASDVTVQPLRADRGCVKQLTRATGLQSLPDTKITYVGRV